MREAYKVTAVLFAVQCLFLMGAALLFHSYGGSLSHEIGGQDAREYILLGQSLLTSGQFHLPGSLVPETWRTPGYPALVAAVFLVTHNSLSTLLVLLALISAATSGLIFL